MSVELPSALRAALDRELEGASRGRLAERAAKTSAAYRAGKGSAGVIRDTDDALAYALTRLPATYAACVRVFEDLADRVPGFSPATLLDAGSGTAAASWAAAEAFDSLEAATWVDASAPFMVTAKRLAAEGPAPLAAPTTLQTSLDGSPLPPAELVAASYVLAEIAPARQPEAVAALWAAAQGVLVIVEPGTPAGAQRILAARDVLISAGAEILAPCPHEAACPLAGDEPTAPGWCHFSVRLPRSRDHKLLKGADVPFEDEKFSYLIAAQPGLGRRAQARILAPARHGKPGIDLRLCAPAGLETRFIPRRDKPAHAAGRRLDWGDAL